MMLTYHIFRIESDLPHWLNIRTLAAFAAKNLPGVDVHPGTLYRVLRQIMAPPAAEAGMVVTAQAPQELAGVLLVSRGKKEVKPSGYIAVNPNYRNREIEEKLQAKGEEAVGNSLAILASPSQGLNIAANRP
jgi:hypothetical protein